jgi:ADP-ribose pyrophosphatase
MQNTPDNTWHTRATRTVFENPPYVRVEQHTIELPDGQLIEDWSWIDMPDYVNVLVLTPQKQVALFRQTKYGIEGDSLAPVGGYIDEGETPLEAAQRELREEMGMVASGWQSLGGYRADANRGCGNGHLFLATGAEQVTAPDSDDLEEQHLVFLTLDELEQALLNGECTVLGWAANIALALLHLRRT